MISTTSHPRVLWLTPDKPDDISVGRDRIATVLNRTGYDVDVRGTSGWSFLRSLREGGRYDVVLGTTRLGAIAGMAVSELRRIPLVVDHIDPIRQLRRTETAPVVAVVTRLEHLTFRRAAHVLYVYSEERPRVERRAKAFTETDLGVDVDRFVDPDPSAVDAVRESLGSLPENVAIYVGGLEPVYNVRPLLSAADHLDDDWLVLVAGAGTLESDVADAAATSDRIRFIGMVSHETIPGYLHVSDVGVSLVDDPNTLKVLEYGTAGLSVVQLAGRAESRFGDMVEYCSTEPVAIASAIQRAERRDAGGKLRKYASAFDWTEIASDYADAIDAALD